MIQIYNASNDRRPFIDILQMVEIGGYIAASNTIIKKTGWRSSRIVDLRHIDHEPVEVQEYALEMAKAQAFYKAALLALRPFVDRAAWSEEDEWAKYQAHDEPYMHSHPGNGWGL